MLSKKMTFSLMSLLTLIAFAFAFVADDAFAAAKPFEIKIVGRTTATYVLDDATTVDVNESEVTVLLTVESAQPIGALTATATAFDRNGFIVGGASATELPKVPVTVDGVDGDFYAMRTGKKRQLKVVITAQITADENEPPNPVIAKVVIAIAAGIKTTDPTVLATDGTDTKLNESKLVQHTITLSEAVDTSNLPKVVSIQRLRPGSQTVVSAFQEERIVAAPFNVRIVLTELPNGIDLADVNNLVEVENGTVSGLVIGTLFARFGGVYEVGDIPGRRRSSGVSGW